MPRLLPYLLPALLAAQTHRIGGRQSATRHCLKQRNGDAAGLGQLYAGNNARSARYGLKRIDPGNHGCQS